MNYYFSKILSATFDDAIGRVTDELKKEGFGVLTEIDVKETLKKKLNVDFHRYKILGACNPPFAYQSLQVDDKIGTMSPCDATAKGTTGDAEESHKTSHRVKRRPAAGIPPGCHRQGEGQAHQDQQRAIRA